MSRLDEAAGRLLRRRAVPALAVAACRRGRLVLERAWGQADLAAGAPAAPSHVFQACSVTKLFTATAVVQLSERGRLGLDEPLDRHLADLGPGFSAVTARHLLAHHAGLRDPLRPAPVLRPGERPRPARERLEGGARPSPRPAGGGAYANRHYEVLACLVESVTGEPLDQYVLREILAPAGLGDAAYGYPPALAPRAATGYVGAFFERALLRLLGGGAASGLFAERSGRLVALRPYVPAEWGAGGVVANAAALARFGALHLGFPEDVAGRVLGHVAADAMRVSFGRIRIGPASTMCGLGWWLGAKGDQAFAEHWGRAPGFTAALRVLPGQDLSIALFVNRVQIDPRPWERMLDLAADAATAL